MKLFKYSVFASIFTVSLLAGGTVVLAQSAAVAPVASTVYETPGVKIPVNELVDVKGRLISPDGQTNITSRATSQFQTEKGNLIVFQNKSRCARLVMKIESAFVDGDITTLETSHLNNPFFCSYENGMAFSYNVKSKTGNFYTRASQENKVFTAKGVLEIN